MSLVLQLTVEASDQALPADMPVLCISCMWSLMLQLTVEASDQALPADKTTTVQVIVSVPRDSRPPRFDRNQFTATLPENKPVNSSVVTVRARDPNQQVRHSGPDPNAFNGFNGFNSFNGFATRLKADHPLFDWLINCVILNHF